MARKSIDITIDRKGRDLGKVFRIKEMSADDTEQWAIRAFFALMNTGVELPEDMDMDMASIARLGFQALGRLPFEAAKPLLDDMWQCVEIIPDPKKPNVVRMLIDDDIEEAATRLQLRKAIFDLHTGFFTDGDQ